jgi:hypothetical protein
MVAGQLLLRVKRGAAQRAERIAALHMCKAVQAPVVACRRPAARQGEIPDSKRHATTGATREVSQALLGWYRCSMSPCPCKQLLSSAVGHAAQKQVLGPSNSMFITAGHMAADASQVPGRLAV